jgi:hypothetical protein
MLRSDSITRTAPVSALQFKLELPLIFRFVQKVSEGSATFAYGPCLS